MFHDLREVFWWEGLKKNITDLVSKCPNCKQVKAQHQKPGGLLYEIEVPTSKWENINMGFVVCLSRTQKQYESIWVVVGRLNKSAHFIPVKTNNSVEDYAKIFIDEIMFCHDILLSIISDLGAQFTSRFWRLFQKGLGNKVKLSTAFHPQTDGQMECTIQALANMLRACIIDFKEN